MAHQKEQNAQATNMKPRRKQQCDCEKLGFAVYVSEFSVSLMERFTSRSKQIVPSLVCPVTELNVHHHLSVSQ